MPLLDHVERGLEFADLLALPAALDNFSVASRAVISQERQVLTAPDASRLARPAVVADQGSEVLREASQPALERFGCQILVAHAYHAAAVVALHGVVDAPDVVVGRVAQVAADDFDAEGLHAANLHGRAALSLWAAWDAGQMRARRRCRRITRGDEPWVRGPATNVPPCFGITNCERLCCGPLRLHRAPSAGTEPGGNTSPRDRCDQTTCARLFRLS